MSRRGLSRGVSLAPCGLAAVLVTVALLAASAGVAAAEARAKPKVPIGVDPGGVAVAVIGDGIDYTRPDIAARLARDGEGEIAGFDLVDRDRLPYAPTPPEGTCGATPGTAAGACVPEHPALTVLRHAPAARIAVFRVDGKQPRLVAEAIAMAAQSPARIVLLQAPPPADLMKEAAARFPELSFKVPRPATADGYAASLAALGNVVVGCPSTPADAGVCGTAAEHAALAAIAAGGRAAP